MSASPRSLRRFRAALSALALAAGVLAASPGAASASGHVLSPPDPPWLHFGPGTLALVDVAPWKSKTLDAALTADEFSAEDMAEEEQDPPDDVVQRNAGFLVKVERLLDDGVVMVAGTTDAGPRMAYTLTERLEPRVPPGTQLVTAGGFAGFAYFYPTLGASQDRAQRLETGTVISAGETSVGGVRGETIDFLRMHIRVLSGPLRGQTGWIAVGYGGLPRPPGYGSTPTERQCHCRVVEFR